MKKLVIFSIIALFMVGCASLKQAKSDAQIGYTAPLSQGEIAPLDQAKPIAATATGALVSALPIAAPFSMPIQGAIASAVGLFFAWQRGRSIRKGQPVSSNPVTGFLGNTVGIEGLIQNLANIVTGAFHTGPNETPLGHAWQVFLSAALGIGTSALAFPQVQQFVMANPGITAGVAGLASVFAGLQKSLGTVLPVNPASA